MREPWHSQLSSINNEELLSYTRVYHFSKKLSINELLKQEYFSQYFVTSQQPDDLFAGFF